MTHFFLKNGHTVNIRSITRQDAVVRHKFFCDISRAQIGMIHSADEIDEDPQESLEQIDDFFYMRRGLWLIAENEKGDIVGEIDITVKPWRRIRHVGALTMGVAPSVQGQGLGNLLLEEALKWAKVQGLTRIELYTFSSNIKAQNLYIKHGFIKEGTRKNYIRLDNGGYEDDYLFARQL